MSFVRAARAWQQSGIRQQEEQEREAERERQERDDQIRQAALLAGLQQQGIVPHDQVTRTRTPSAPGIPSMNVPMGARLGDTPYSQDLTRTPEARERARQIATERAERERLRPAIALAKLRVPELQGADDEAVMVWLRNKELREAMQGGEDVNWQTEVDEGGNVVRINPRTGQTEYVNAPGGGTMRARPPASLIMPPSYNITPTDQGIVAIDPRDPGRGATPVRGPTGEPLRGSAQATEYERKAGMLMPRLQQAVTELDNLGVDLTDERALLDIASPSAAASLPGIGSRVGESFSSEGRQRARNALENVLAVSLRLESGANITEEEALRQARNMLPTFFDQEGTKRQKLRLVAATIQGATSAAGRAAPAASGPPKASGVSDADLADIVNRYKPRQ